MKDNEFNEMLEHLKAMYAQMPQQTSPDEIIERINKDKRTRWPIPKKAIVSVIVAASIGAILLFTQFSIFDEQTEFAEQSEADMNLFYHNEQAENEERMTEFSIPRAEDTETIELEGMEETISIKPIFHEELSFQSVVDERYEVETDRNQLKVYANFVGERIEPAFFTIEKHENAASLADVKERIRLKYEQAQYEVTKSEPFFKDLNTELNIVEESAFSKEDSFIYSAVVEARGEFFELTVLLTGEVSERTAEDARLIIERAQFAE